MGHGGSEGKRADRSGRPRCDHRRMLRTTRIAWVWLVLTGCEKSTPAEPDLTTPSGAARCQVEAIRARSVDRWAACWHPRIRAEAARELGTKADKPGFWDRTAAEAAPLESATDAGFTTSPTEGAAASYGDQRATFQLRKDALELVRSNGRWYIVDSGV